MVCDLRIGKEFIRKKKVKSEKSNWDKVFFVIHNKEPCKSGRKTIYIEK